MASNKVYRAIGLMSGTSLDGVDIAYIETDGKDDVVRKRFETHLYTPDERRTIRAALGKSIRDAAVEKAEGVVTQKHIDLVKAFIDKNNLKGKVDIIGFHGQTIFHAPDRGFTWQIGDGAALAKSLGINVVADMRQADIKAGGQGAPLLPLYHRALATGLVKPVAMLNIGGVSNMTWLSDNETVAFDCGPGNALIDDFVLNRVGKRFDEKGALARSGKPDENLLAQWMDNPYFKVKPPKSLDRDGWDVSGVKKLSDAQGAATLTAFTIRAIQKGFAHFPKPRACYVTGGGRNNTFMMESLATALGCRVEPVEAHEWNGDAMEAEGFAYLAVRSLLKLPLSEPGTTGVPQPITGGVLHKAPK